MVLLLFCSEMEKWKIDCIKAACIASCMHAVNKMHAMHAWFLACFLQRMASMVSTRFKASKSGFSDYGTNFSQKSVAVPFESVPRSVSQPQQHRQHFFIIIVFGYHNRFSSEVEHNFGCCRDFPPPSASIAIAATFMLSSQIHIQQCRTIQQSLPSRRSHRERRHQSST